MKSIGIIIVLLLLTVGAGKLAVGLFGEGAIAAYVAGALLLVALLVLGRNETQKNQEERESGPTEGNQYSNKKNRESASDLSNQRPQNKIPTQVQEQSRPLNNTRHHDGRKNTVLASSPIPRGARIYLKRPEAPFSPSSKSSAQRTAATKKRSVSPEISSRSLETYRERMEREKRNKGVRRALLKLSVMVIALIGLIICGLMLIK